MTSHAHTIQGFDFEGKEVKDQETTSYAEMEGCESSCSFAKQSRSTRASSCHHLNVFLKAYSQAVIR